MVQGPPTIMAAAQLGAPFNRVAMAFSRGSYHQCDPALRGLPLLGATETEMRNIMGYCLVTTIILFIVVALIYLYLPM